MTVDGLLTGLASLGFEPGLTHESYEHICSCGFRGIDSNIAVAVLAEFGDACAEIDALPPNELRRRVTDAIGCCIPDGEWERLKTVERLEKEAFGSLLIGVV